MHRSEGLFRIKEKLLAEKKIELLTNSTLIESQGIKHSTFVTYVEEMLSGFNRRQRTIVKKRINEVLFDLEMSVEIFKLSKMFSHSRFSTAIFKILQSVKILILMRTYLTIPQVVHLVQPKQWKMYQHEEISNLTWIFLIAQSDVI